MIALLRSTDGNPDSRFEKYVNFLSDEGINYFTCCWDRKCIKIDSPCNVYFHSLAKYGDGLKNIWNLFRFNVFIFITLYRRRKEYNVIHAADLDTILPAIFIKVLFRKKIIYDIYDWYIDSRCIKNRLAITLIKFIEKFCINFSDIVIICEPERESQILYRPKELWILPNIPNIPNIPSIRPFENISQHSLTISYVGILGYERGLEKLIRYVKEHSEVKLEIAGFGPLENLLEDVNKYPNIKYYGSVKYDVGLKIMRQSDLIYAVYEKSNPNHILAAPNKYYEGLYLGKPIITTEGTIVGEKTIKYNTGFCIQETYSDLQNLFKTINRDMINERSINAFKLWEKSYSTYTQTFLKSKYLAFLNDNKS